MKTANLTLTSVDLGKNCFHFHGQDGSGNKLFSCKVSRTKVFEFIAQLPVCTLAMEACGGAHYMGRFAASCGHEPRLIAAQHVSPFVKSNKNDFADAEAIGEAASRPAMRFVALKTEQQQALCLLNGIRDAFIHDRTATSNRIHAYLLEFGMALQPSFATIRKLPVILEELKAPPLVIRLLQDLHAHFVYLDGRIDALTKEVRSQAAEDDLASRLMTIPCVGPITSSVLAATIGDGKQFKCGRDYAASIGLVPRQHTTGGRPRLLGISKRGNPNERRLAVQCSNTFILHLDRQTGALADWVRKMLVGHHRNVVVCALANKLARIAWALAHTHGIYEARPSVLNA
ncbi:IS110 family transposase [Pseudomonas japonica]|uniref:Transposase n=1 Tax=Pseudomonas japonica TaxID=256466 RepID=A0A239K964_9PSED|nr:IS110 family transposase [Pseudomonas japonica]SNT14212.1 Transposase [Pseudomonas japonica]